MLGNVFGRVFDAHVRQAGALEVEAGQFVAVYLERGVRFRIAVDVLLRIRGCFAALLWVVENSGALWRHNRLTRNIRGVDNAGIRLRDVACPHSTNYAIIP